MRENYSMNIHVNKWLLLILLLCSRPLYAETNYLYVSDFIEHQPAVNRPIYISYPSHNKITPIYRYPEKNYVKQSRNSIYEASTRIIRTITPNTTNKKYDRTNSNVLYVSDLEPIRHTLMKKNKAMLYEYKNMIPAYDQLRPDYNSGELNNIQRNPYNSLNRFGIFSRQ